MTSPTPSPLRQTVRRELVLDERRAAESARARSCSRAAALLRVAMLVAVAGGLADGVSAQAPYRQEVLPGFSSLDANDSARPDLVDLDGDGDLDAVVGERSGKLRYFANTGSSAAGVFVEATGGANPFAAFDVGYLGAPELADLDGDGDLDAVVGETDGNLNYFANTGSSAAPAFAAMTGSANPFLGIAVGIYSTPALADLDGDGDLDAIVGEFDGVFNYFANTGSSAVPAFVAMTGSANPLVSADVGLASAPDLVDLDDDGDLDAIVGERYGTIAYFANTGSSTVPAFVLATGTAHPFLGIDLGVLASPDLADLDGDGDLDAVVGDYYASLWLFANTGSSAVPAFVEVSGSANPILGVGVAFYGNPNLEDLDGDGDLDAVVGRESGTLAFYRNTGSATAPAFAVATGTANPLSGFDVGSRSSPDLADLDGDGDLDAVVGNLAGTLAYFRNSGSSVTPAFVAATGTANPFGAIDVDDESDADLADLDADGDLDAIVGNYLATLAYFRNSGSSVAPAFVELTGTANPFAGFGFGLSASPHLVDLDADGDLDAVVGSSLGTLAYFVNSGSAAVPAFAAATGSADPFPGIDLGNRSFPALADLDGDGDLDALVGEVSGRLVLFRSRRNLFSDDFEGGDLTAWSNF